MSGNQFRRDPITSQWSIILEDKYDIKKLITHTKQRQPQVFVNKTKYSEGNESKTLPEIYALREHHSTVNGPGWKVRIIPYEQPFLEIYGGLKSRGIGLYDVIDGVGAHELVIEAPTANIQMYDMGVEQIKYILEAYRERISDLKRDNRFRCCRAAQRKG